MGWWKFDRLFYDDVDNATAIDYCGRFVWVLTGSTTRVYDVYDLEQWQAYEDDYVQQEPNISMSPYKNFNVGGSSLIASSDRCYITTGETFTQIKIVDLAGNITTINTPVSMFGNINLHAGKLWMVSSVVDANDEPSLYCYKLNTQTWTSIVLPVRKQLEEPYYVGNDKGGNVLVTIYNELAVVKINSETDTYTSKIRLDDGSGANRGPHLIFTGSDLTVYVCSLNNMVSMVDTTLDTVDHEYSSLGECGGMCDDGTYLWFSSGELVRSRKTDADIRQTNGNEDDYSFEPSQFPSMGFTHLVRTIGHDYQTKDGTETVGEYIFVTTDSHVIAFRNDDEYYRTLYTRFNGVGMISSGPHDYTGD